MKRKDGEGKILPVPPAPPHTHTHAHTHEHTHTSFLQQILSMAKNMLGVEGWKERKGRRGGWVGDGSQ